MKRLLLLLTLPFLFALGPSQFAGSVERLEFDEPGHCTAFSINQKEGYWLTASHCLEPAGMYIRGKLAKEVKVDLNMDLLILQSEVKAPALKLASTRPNEGDVIVSVGYPQWSEKLVVFWGRVVYPNASLSADLNPGMVGHEGGGPGMSGGPIVNEKGKVVSVLLGGAPMPSLLVFGPSWSDVVRFTRGYWK